MALTMTDEREFVLRSETSNPSHDRCPDHWADCNWAREAAVEFAAELDATRARVAELEAKRAHETQHLLNCCAERDKALAARGAECAAVGRAVVLHETRLSDGTTTALELAFRGPDANIVARLLSRPPGTDAALRAHTERAIMETAREIVRRGDLLWKFMSKDGAEAEAVSGALYAGELDTMILTDYTDVDDPDFKRLVARLLEPPAEARDGGAR